MTHLIYIHTHDSGRFTGAYGFGNKDSAIRKFAEDALLFRQAYTTNPTCSPSRSSLLTGLYPHEMGMLGLANRGFSIDDYNKHLVSIMKKQGYKTVLCGIQHEAGRYTDHEKGAQTIGYDLNLSANYDMSDESKLHLWDQENAKILREWLLEYDSSKPLFLSYGLFTTHRPFPNLDVPYTDPNYISVPKMVQDNPSTRHDYAKYLDSLEIADQCFGDIIQTLKNTGIYEDAIIVFTTDHGIAMPFAKANLTDYGIGVSFIMRIPQMQKTGITTDSLVSQVDFVPTIVDLLNIKTDRKFSGKSFAKLFFDKDIKIREDIFSTLNFHTSYEPTRAIRTERYKYIRYFDDYLGMNLSNMDASETKDFYLEHDLRSKTKMQENLFDLLYDPAEKNNLATQAEYFEVLESMRKRLYNYMKKTQDPLLNGPIKIQKHWKVNKVSSETASPKDPSEYIKE